MSFCVYDLKDKMEFIEEVATLEYNQWAENKEENREKRISAKIEKIKENLKDKDFCKLVLIKKNELVGFISIFPSDCDECLELSPWYATMFVKREYRGKGYSKILNDSILNEAKKRNYSKIYLKTCLNNYYEKFGAIFLKQLNSGEKIYVFNLEFT